MKKRILSLLLCMVLCLSILPTMAFAAGFTITIDPNRGSGYMPPIHTADGKFTVPECTLTPPENCVFDGWLLETAYGMQPVAVGEVKTVYRDCYLVAQWKAFPVYSVTFNMGGIGYAPPSQIIEIGSKATKPATPVAGGYTFAGWYKDAALSTRFNFDSPIKANTTIYAKWINNSKVSSFADVKASDYFYTPVLWATAEGITNGMGGNEFAPNQACTRAQVVTFLWRAAGEPAPKGTGGKFSDVASGSYYAKAVAWAVEQGITNGMGYNKFCPNDPCTRGQVVTFLWRAQGRPSVSGGTTFTDVPSGQYYTEAVAWAVKNGITNGIGNNKFGPDKPCTRGQIVTFLYRTLV